MLVWMGDIFARKVRIKDISSQKEMSAQATLNSVGLDFGQLDLFSLFSLILIYLFHKILTTWIIFLGLNTCYESVIKKLIIKPIISNYCYIKI